VSFSWAAARASALRRLYPTRVGVQTRDHARDAADESVLARASQRASPDRRGASDARSSGDLPAAVRDRLGDELLADRRSQEEIAGPGRLLADLPGAWSTGAMPAELTEHLGYNPHAAPPGGADNTATARRPRRL